MKNKNSLQETSSAIYQFKYKTTCFQSAIQQKKEDFQDNINNLHTNDFLVDKIVKQENDTEKEQDFSNYLNRAIVLVQMKRNEEAFENYDSAIQKNPENSDLYKCKAITLYKMNRFKEVLENYLSAI